MATNSSANPAVPSKMRPRSTMRAPASRARTRFWAQRIWFSMGLQPHT